MSEWHEDNAECGAPLGGPHAHELAELVDQDAAPAPAGPVPMVSGTFAVYQGPKGELVLVTDIDGRGVERKVFPKALIRFAQAGPLGAMLRRANGD